MINVSMTYCDNCGDIKDTDHDNGIFYGTDKYICEYCLCLYTDEELIEMGISKEDL